MNRIVRVMLYLSSFLPLFILLVIQNIKVRNENGFIGWRNFFHQFVENRWTGPSFIFWFSMLLFIIISVVSIFIFYLVFRKEDGVEKNIKENNFNRADTLGYIVTYIVPLLSIDINSYRSMLVNFLLFIIIGSFYIMNNQFFMNPIFNILRYNVLCSDSGKIYITKLSIREVKEVSKECEKVILISISEDIFLIK